VVDGSPEEVNSPSMEKLTSRQQGPGGAIWMDRHRAASPDGAFVAEVDPAWEASMDVPTYGTLCLSGKLHLERCSPAFVWSSDSRYLAAVQFFHGFWGVRQQVVVIDVVKREVFRSARMSPFLQVTSFADGTLTVVRNPHGRQPATTTWQIPEALSTKFTRDFLPRWSRPSEPR
jgi:hypothetical protein